MRCLGSKTQRRPKAGKRTGPRGRRSVILGGNGKPPHTHLEYVKREISTIVFRDFRMQAFCRLGLRGESLWGKFSSCSSDPGRKRSCCSFPLILVHPRRPPLPGLRLLASTAGPMAMTLNSQLPLLLLRHCHESSVTGDKGANPQV